MNDNEIWPNGRVPSIEMFDELAGQVQGTQLALAMVLNQLARSTQPDDMDKIADAMRKMAEYHKLLLGGDERTENTAKGLGHALETTAALIATEAKQPDLTVIPGGKTEPDISD